MNLHISIYDDAVPMLDEIAKWSHKAALAALDQAGIELRDRTREAFDASQRSEWSVHLNKAGKRVWTRGVMGNRFGRRFNFKKAGPESMGNMIDSFLMENSLTLVVAGMHKNFTPRFYRKELKTNSDIKIYGKGVKQVLGGSWEILQKLNTGGRYSQQSSRYKGTRQGEDTKPYGKDARYKPRRFAERGRLAAMGRVTEIMTTTLEGLIHRQVNRATVKTQVRTA